MVERENSSVNAETSKSYSPINYPLIAEFPCESMDYLGCKLTVSPFYGLSSFFFIKLHVLDHSDPFQILWILAEHFQDFIGVVDSTDRQ